MGKSSYETQRRYELKAFDTVTFRVTKGHRQKIRSAADQAGVPMNQYICDALNAAGCPVTSTALPEKDRG